MRENTSAIDPKTNGKLRLILMQLPYLVLYVIAILLTGLTNSDPGSAVDKWYGFILVVALVAIVGGWARQAGQDNRRRRGYVIREILHWGALVFVMYFLFRPDLQHFLSAESHGFVAVYLMGLTAMLSGLHSDWRMAVFGVFVILSGVTVAWFEDNALMIVGVVGAVAILSTVVTVLFLRSRSHRAARTAA